jgi:4-amino-4-deoxy-L-arabinose transferase-like glycosyltransferase
MLAFFKRLTSLQATLLLIATCTLLRLLAAGNAGLSVDEAHYALYGYHLDWSYFDHPPMIGWLQAIALKFSASDLAMRVLPILLFVATSWVMYRVTLTLFPKESPWLGFISVALMQSGIMFQLIGMAMLPDTPLLLLGLLLLGVLYSIVIEGRVRYWLWLGVLLGLAALSKYTSISLLMTVILVLTIGKQWKQLLTPWPWLAIAVGSILILPILYWNYHHEWISFLYQLHHGTGNSGWDWLRFIESEGAQLLVYGPGVFIFGLIALVAGFRNWRESGAWMCLSFALPVLLLFGMGAGYEMTLPHWTSLGWAGLAPLTAYWLYRHWQSKWVRIGVRTAIAYSIIVSAIIFSELISPWIPFDDKGNPLQDLYGWQKAAQRAEQLRQEMITGKNTNPPQLFTDNWTYASRLAWYDRPTPVQVLDNRYDQFDIWFGSPQYKARGIVVLWPDQDTDMATGGAGQFSSCKLLEKLPISNHGHLISTFTYYSCYGFRN